MATWSMVSTSPVVLAPAGMSYDYSDSVFTPHGFQVRIATGATGLFITKAASFGGTQAPCLSPSLWTTPATWLRHFSNSPRRPEPAWL